MGSRKSNILFDTPNKQHQIKQQPQQLHQTQLQLLSPRYSVRKSIVDKLPDLQENDLAMLTLDKPAFQQHQNQQQQQQQHQQQQQQQHQQQHQQQQQQIHHQDQKKTERFSSVPSSKIPTLQKMSVLHETDLPIVKIKTTTAPQQQQQNKTSLYQDHEDDTIRQRVGSLCPSKIPILKKISTMHEIDPSMLEVISRSTLEEKTIRISRQEQLYAIKAKNMTPIHSPLRLATPLPPILKESESLTKTTNASTFQESMTESNIQKQHWDASNSVIMKCIANETDAITKGMEKCIKLVENNSSTALKTIRKYISSAGQNDVIKRNMAMWKDEYNLNLIHYAIIYSRPEILKYLLADSRTFPPESQPAICPYAHLAAYLGATTCIKIILTERPDDFFESNLPEHDIILPSHLVARFGLHKLNKKSKIDQTLNRIKHFKSQCRGSAQCLVDLQSDNVQDLVNHLQGICFGESKPEKISLPPIECKRITNHLGLRMRKSKSVSYANLYPDKTGKTELPEATDYFMGKTPLMLAAEKLHAKTMCTILELKVHKQTKREKTMKRKVYGPLTMATIVMSPEAIVAMFKVGEIKSNDYKDAVLIAIKELLPDCLIALLSNRPNKFKDEFGGVNKYHILYSQCVDADESKYRMLPQMTQALIHCNEDVNKYCAAQTFPLYSLITISFKVGSTRMLYHTFECLQLLLEAEANPFFNERLKANHTITLSKNNSFLLRGAYTSAFNCIFDNATSPDLRINPELAHVIMNNCMLYAIILNKTNFEITTEDTLFQYMKNAFHLGLNSQIIKTLLEFGVDPNITVDDKYFVNAYFDELFGFFREFPRKKSQEYYIKEMETLMLVCQRMWSIELKKAVKIILRQYVHNIPLEAVAITRYFFYLADNLMKNNKRRKPRNSAVTELFINNVLIVNPDTDLPYFMRRTSSTSID